MRFLFGFIFNDLQSLKMAAHPYAAETLNKSEFPELPQLLAMQAWQPCAMLKTVNEGDHDDCSTRN
jgi:hypothetical protein